MIDNRVEHKGKKLDKIFVEVMSEYKNQDPETFLDAFNSVFSVVYFQGKQLHEVLDSDEISKVLEILEIPQPIGKSSLSKEYLQRQVCREKEQLLKLVSGIRTQQPSPQPENISYETRNPLPNKATNPSPVTNKAPPATNASLKSLLKNRIFLKRDLLLSTFGSSFYVNTLPMSVCFKRVSATRRKGKYGVSIEHRATNINRIMCFGFGSLYIF